MRCPKCRQPLSPSDVKFYVLAPTSMEVQLACACGETYSQWLEHTGWADARSEPADLTEFHSHARRRAGGAS